jgi:hypothetical protein
MTIKKELDKIRGWFPQEPNLAYTRNSKSEEKFQREELYPFLAPGALMIVSALLSALIGLTLVCTYLPDLLEGAETIFYKGLYVGILNVGAFILGILSGSLLLAKKHITTALGSIFGIFCFGIATIIIPRALGGLWQEGVLVASPLLSFSFLSIILVGRNIKKLNDNDVTEGMLTIQGKEPTMSRKPIATGLGAAGCGFLFIGALMNVIMPVFPEITSGYLFVIGISLLIVAYLERRTYSHQHLQDDLK